MYRRNARNGRFYIFYALFHTNLFLKPYRHNEEKSKICQAQKKALTNEGLFFIYTNSLIILQG